MPINKYDVSGMMGPKFYGDGDGGGYQPPTPPPTPPPAPAPPPAYVPPSQAHPEWYDTGISKEQWQAWEKNKAPAEMGCPPDKQYVGRGGQCASKPDDCPEGQQVVGNDAAGTAKCITPGPAKVTEPSPPAKVGEAQPLGPGSYTPPQATDPLASAKSHSSSNASGLGGATGPGGTIQYDPRSQPVGGGGPLPAVPMQEQQKRRASGLGGSPLPTQPIGMGMR